MALPTWHMLSSDLLEYQLGQVDLLLAMYPEEQCSMDDASESISDSIGEAMESNTVPQFDAPPWVSLTLTLPIPDTEDEKALILDIRVPFFTEKPTPSENAPAAKIRVQQPSWLSKAATVELNWRAAQEHDDLFAALHSIPEEAMGLFQEGEKKLSAKNDEVLQEPLVRVWFYFPSISTRSKRDDFIINAPAYGITGFLYAGKPGLLCVEGGSQKIDDYMKFIKTESWGDIPAHHKKVSERYRENGIDGRVFSIMTEETDNPLLGERRGFRGNRGDMQAMERWLSDFGLGEAFTRVLM